MKYRWLMAVALLAGCSQTADSIKPASVDGSKYAAMSCDGLKAENASISATLGDLSAKQAKAAEADKTAFVVGGLLAASVVGEDHSKEIARLKGEQAAIQKASAAHNCQ